TTRMPLSSSVATSHLRAGAPRNVEHRAHEFASGGGQFPVREVLDHGNGLRSALEDACPQQIAGHYAEQSVADLLGVHEQALALGQPSADLLVDRGQGLTGIVVSAEGEIGRRNAEVLIRGHVVRRREDGHDAAEAVLAQPDHLFLTAHFAVAAPVPAGALADSEAVFDDAEEVARLDARRPLALHQLLSTSSPTIRTAATVALTS